MLGTPDLVREAFHAEERRVDWRSGVAGAVAAVGPLALGLAVDRTAGFTAALGGLNVALCVPRADLRGRVWWGSLALVGQTLALLLAGTAYRGDLRLVVLTLVWVGLLALLRAAGPSGAIAGFTTSAVFVILAGLPPSEPLGERLAWFVAGGVVGLVVMVVARSRPERVVPAGRSALRSARDALLQDHALREYAVVLAVAVSAGTLLYRVVDLQHGYWVPITTLAILQPTEHGTRLRSVQRFAGTLLAAALIMGVLVVTDGPWPLITCAVATVFLLFAMDERGYFWLVVLLTPSVLLMISAVDFEGDRLALDRLAYTMLGILIGLILGELANARTRRRGTTRR
jgi:hypothetical protein